MQTDYNEFAGKVLTACQLALGEVDLPDVATMYAGTLFVECSGRTAAKIETALIDELKCGVRVSKVGNEYAFDFVQ